MDRAHTDEKVAARLSPPTPLVALAKDDDLNAEGKRQLTFIVALGYDGVQSAHMKKRKEAAVTGEQTPASDDTQPSPHIPRELPSLVGHATPGRNTSDSDSTRSPIDPPGLSEQIPSTGDQAVAVPPMEVRVEDIDESARPPVVEEPAELDAIFSIDPRVFEWELVYDVSDPIFQLEPTLVEPDLSRYSVSGLPQLDTYIPVDLLPDSLLVHDIDNITRVHFGDSDTQYHRPPVRRYVRIYPKPPGQHGESQSAYEGRDTSKAARSAHLYLQSTNRLGSGSHSFVYRAPLTLRLDGDSGKCTTATVAVKTAHKECGAHLMLDKEATAYNAFPRELMEDTSRPMPDISGTDGAATSLDAVMTSESADEPPSVSHSHDADCLGPAAQSAASAELPRPASRMPVIEGGPAVVPKFYGYYGALNEDGTLHSERHGLQTYCDIDEACYVDWPTRLLLVEECGRPIQPYYMTREERCVHLPQLLFHCIVDAAYSEKVVALTERLHKAGFVNGSPYRRNMLSQPGPLSVPPEERSQYTPSYRIIDFGRADVLSLLPETRHEFFGDCCDADMMRTKRSLFL